MAEMTVRGVRFNYQLDGPAGGTPLVLSNSLSSNLGMWDGQVAELTQRGYRILRYDNRGHGRTDAPAGPYSVAMLAADALALMDAVGFQRAHFCGLSMGGMIGQWLATRHGDRLLSATLCDTAAYMGPPELWADRIKAVQNGGMAAVVDGTLQRWFTPAGLARLTKEIIPVRAGILGTTVTGYTECAGAIRDMDQRESIRGIRVPTHVIVGEDDPGTTVETARFIADRIPAARLTILPGAAHLANIEQCVAFNAALLDFYSRLQ